MYFIDSDSVSQSVSELLANWVSRFAVSEDKQEHLFKAPLQNFEKRLLA